MRDITAVGPTELIGVGIVHAERADMPAKQVAKLMKKSRKLLRGLEPPIEQNTPVIGGAASR